jgi:hypothetical protein
MLMLLFQVANALIKYYIRLKDCVVTYNFTAYVFIYLF